MLKGLDLPATVHSVIHAGKAMLFDQLCVGALPRQRAALTLFRQAKGDQHPNFCYKLTTQEVCSYLDEPVSALELEYAEASVHIHSVLIGLYEILI